MSGKMTTFLLWCKNNNLILNEKVKICKAGSCHRYGMIATQDIQKNECLFTIPRKLLLEAKTSSIANIIVDIDEDLTELSGRGSGWVPLLLSLMYEYTNAESFWKPYLDIVPSLTELDQPMFWNKKDRKCLLKDTEIFDDVEQDLKCIEKEYNEVVKGFIKKHEDKFDLSIHSLDLYKHMASFLMAYSFTENGCHGNCTPVMVPMADILNHHSKNNAHLEFAKDELKMVSTQAITKGQEVFNTYGQLANCHLLQSYGFVEKTPNPYDFIEISVGMFYGVLQKQVTSKHEARLLDAKFQFMEELGLVTSEDSFPFDLKGCQISGTDLLLFLKFLHLSESELHLIVNQENIDIPNELCDLITHFKLCNEEQKISSYEVLNRALNFKERKRKKGAETEQLEKPKPKLAKRLCRGLSKNENVSGEKNVTIDIGVADGSSINYGDDSDPEESDCVDYYVDGDDYGDKNDVFDEYMEEDDGDDDNDNEVNDYGLVSETEEDEELDHITYEQMSEFSLNWRKTLSSVAKECSLKVDVILKDKKLDVEKEFHSREHAIRHILLSLRNILQLVIKLERNSSS
ncbi:N-lysine methyltransferase setd6 [Exaiptasia diaphana]|nr:N-lysine methyltransferase setd6 [Exaiptasia diaphana]